LTLPREIGLDILRFLMIVNAGAGIVIWAMGIHQSLRMASHAPMWRGWLTLRRPLASELPQPYITHRRQVIRLMLAFVGTLAIEAFLALLYTLFFRPVN
jgi:hypothetical protein